MISEIKLSYRTNVKASQRPKITNSKDAYTLLLDSWSNDKIEFVEEFKVMLLNRSNKVLGIVEISSGCSTGTVADPKMIFAAAIKTNSYGIILAHNHPSSNIQPSSSDKELTRKLREGGRFLDVAVLDHIILSKEGFFSFADEGLL